MDRTIRLFDLDSAEVAFEAEVISCESVDGNKYDVVLDRTLFFPEEGGQSCDTGTLGGADVMHVYEKEEIIHHVLASPVVVGGTVSGEIDFPERFRKMQSHTAEHIVSGLIHKKFGFSNVGFHLSRDEMTADFDGELDKAQLELIETLANQAVFECHAVRVCYPDAKTLASLEYRSKLDLTENVRIVEIEGVDMCACCAPHVKNTGEIGLIKILRAEKYKGGVRLYMKAGYDALEGYRAEYEQARRISVATSAPHDEVAEGVEHLLGEIDALKGRISRMKREIMEYKLSRIEYTEGNLVLFDEDGDMLALRNLVNEAKKLCGGICACFSGSDESGYKYIISSNTVDLRAKTKEFNAAILGKGGGSSEMIQGRCAAKRADIEKYFTLI